MTVIIVLKVRAVRGQHEVGVVVDGVKEVVDIDAALMRPAPDLCARQAIECISGLLANGERMVVLLDVDRVVGSAATDSARTA